MTHLSSKRRNYAQLVVVVVVLVVVVVVVVAEQSLGAEYRRMIHRLSPPGKGAPDMGVVLD